MHEDEPRRIRVGERPNEDRIDELPRVSERDIYFWNTRSEVLSCGLPAPSHAVRFCRIDTILMSAPALLLLDRRATMAKRASSKRDLVKNRGGEFYAKRDANGRFKEMDEVGRSLTADRRQHAKRETKSGHGDQGDRKRK